MEGGKTGKHGNSKPGLVCDFIDLFHASVLLLSFFNYLFSFRFYFTKYPSNDTMTRIRLCSIKCLVGCIGIAVLVLIARKSLLWKNSPSTKKRSTFYQELAPQLSHSQGTSIFYDIKSGFFCKMEKKKLCKAISF